MSEPLEFTGERFTPECVREIWYEHWHRYAWVLPLAGGKRVLDAACGEGYGAALLAGVAASVCAVDLSAEAVAHAGARYAHVPRLTFRQGDATDLALPPQSFDLITCFETLEHVHEQARMLEGFSRLLAPGGVLVVSSPDKATYSDRTGFHNEHHVRELYREELLALLAPHFGAVRLLGQKLAFQSVIWPLNLPAEGCRAQTLEAGDAAPRDGFGYDPLYFIAVCARHEADLPEALCKPLSLFGDRAESVYTHYNHEVRKNMRAGTLLADLQQQLENARAGSGAAAAPRWVDWLRRQWRRLRR